MQKIFALCWMVFLAVPALFAQRITIPREVSQQFSRQFSRPENVQWMSLKNDNYQAYFNQNGVVKKVVFARTGQWLSIENPVNANELPIPVTRTLSSEYAGYVLNQALRVETFGKGVGFRLKIKTRNGSFELEIGNDGRIYRRVPVEYDPDRHDDDDDCGHHHDKPKHKHKDKEKHHHKHCHHGHCDHHDHDKHHHHGQDHCDEDDD